MNDYHFGRKEAPDSRDANFPMRLRLDPLRQEYFPRGLPQGNRHYRSGPVRAQLKTGTCVAHSWTAKVNAAPIMQQMKLTPYDFYRRIVAIDEWADNDFEATAADVQLQSGTSVRAGAKTLVDLGYAENYLWAESAEDVRAWMLAGFGGVVAGITWTDQMMQPDAEGFVSYSGTHRGGHAIYLNGWNDTVKHNGVRVRAARIQNSWGTGWGQGGRCWITEDDLQRALEADGEAAALTEVRIPR